MIVAVKRNGPKRKLIRVISLVAVIAMFTAYYFHMSEEFTQAQEKEKQKVVKQEQKTESTKKAKELERLIFKEIETAVDLIGQEYVQKVKVIKGKVLITCDSSTNLEPLKVRYGSLALIKTTLNDIKVAIDMKYIVESKYDGK